MRYIETIKLIDGVLQNEEYHRDRVFRTIGRTIDFGGFTTLNGIVKLRIVYDEYGVIARESIPYQLPTITSLKLIRSDAIEYDFKYEDRRSINGLLSQRGECDDVLIVKNGFLTDTSFGNIVLENKEGFFTPTTFLLRGTKREQLLKNDKITLREITVNDLKNYHTIHVINAMIELGEVVVSKNAIQER